MNHAPYETNKVLVLGGAFSTGKSTMLERIKRNYGERFRYIGDGAREIIKEHTNGATSVEGCDVETLKNIQFDVMDYYLHAEANSDGRLTVSDGSLVEVKAYSEGVLGKSELAVLQSVLNYRHYKNLYSYVKFPIETTPITYDGVRHVDYAMQRVFDERINTVLSELPHMPLLWLPQGMEEFRDRYKRVLRFLFKTESSL